MSNKVMKIGGANLVIPEMFEKLKPIDLPQIPFEKGLISGLIHKKKVQRMAEVAKYERQISEDREASMAATGRSIINSLTFGLQYEDRKDELQHRIEMRGYERKQAEAGVAKTVLQCQLLQIDVEEAKMMFKFKKKEMGYVDEDEDRD